MKPARVVKRQVNQQAPRSKTVQIPVPTKGWNTEQSLAQMEPGFAPVLDNWYPDPDGIRPRFGSFAHATGAGGDVETLMSYVSGTTKKLFAASGANIYDATAAGAVGAAAFSTATSDRWQSVNFATSGGQFLIACNGADHPINYNGTAFAATPAITGVTGGASTLVNVFSSQSRLFFCQKDSASVWYLGASAIGGAATEFPLAALLLKGGSIVAGLTWSTDSGSGMDDRTVFVSSEGEVLLYQGTDPSSSTTWALKGRYSIGKPLGYRCLAKFGGDIAVLTQDGLISLGGSMALDRTASQQAALTRNIRKAYADAVKGNEGTFGWQTVGFAAGQMVIVNVPNSSTGASQQFVMNTLNGAWTRYKGLNALAWVEHDNGVYFGSDGGEIWRAESGSVDGFLPIQLYGIGAFMALDEATALKTAATVRMVWRGASNAPIYLSIATDYDFSPPFEEYDAIFANGYYFTWDVSLWDFTFWPAEDEIGSSSDTLVWNQGDWNEGSWAGGGGMNNKTFSVYGSGQALAVAMRYDMQGSSARDPVTKIFRFDLTYEAGEPF
jgi:hypothetical protein